MRINIQKEKAFWWASLATLLIICGIYIGQVNQYAVNIPVAEEFDTFGLDFLDRFLESKTLSERIALVFQQEDDHRPIAYKAIILGQYFISGKVNFRFLILLGAFLYLAFIAFFFFLFFKLPADLPWLIPIAFLFILPMNRVSNWSETSLLYPLNFFFLTASLFFLKKTGLKNILLSILFFLLVLSINSGAIFLFLTGVFLLALQKERAVYQSVIWTTACGFFTWLYLSNFENVRTEEPVIAYFSANFLYVIKFFFVYLAGAFKPLFTSHISVGVLLGVSSLALIKWTVFRNWNYFRERPVLFGLIIYLLGVAAASALIRSQAGMIMATADRYQPIFNLFTSLVFILIFRFYPRAVKGSFGIILGISLILYIFRIEENLYSLDHRKEWVEMGFYEALAGHEEYELDHFKKEQAPLLAIVRKAIQTKRYRPPQDYSFLAQKIQLPLDQLEPDLKKGILKILDDIKPGRKDIIVRGWGAIEKQNTWNMQKVLILASPKDTFYFSTRDELREDVTRAMEGVLNYDHSGFEVIIPFNDLSLPPGEYQFGLFLQKGEYWGKDFFKDKSVRIPAYGSDQ